MFDWNNANDENKRGFFDLPPEDFCNHPEHDPPSHMVIPEGKGYRHVCPGCGRVVVLRGSAVRW